MTILPKWATCVYCGCAAESLDHTTPVSWRRNAKNAKVCDGGFAKKNTVPSCKNCNCTLGAYPFFKVSDRAAHIAERLSIKHARLLNSPVWAEDEIKALGPNLRRKIKHKQFKRQQTIERIRHASTVALLTDINNEMVWNATLSKDDLLNVLCRMSSEIGNNSAAI